MMYRNLIAVLMMASAVGASAAPSTGVDGKPVSALSQSFEAKGQAALAKGQPVAAIDAFETALAVDPANANAYIGIARAYEAQGLTGKAVRYWGDALQLDPNDIAALEGQGLALVARGANARANVNLQRIKTLCKTDCAAATRLQTAMTEAAAKAAKAPVTASAEPAKPVAAAKN